MIHIEFYVLAVPKMLLEHKFPGGTEQFKKCIPNHSYQEDEQLATARFVRINELFHFISTIEELGLHFDGQANYSEDFAVYSCLGLLWQADWLQTDLYRLWLQGSN